jgi:hypothetical protein
MSFAFSRMLLAPAAALLAATSSALSAQAGHEHHGAHAGHAAASLVLTDHARAQIDSARMVLNRFDTPAKAIAAGYRPVLGDVPLQGVHYVNRAVLSAGKFEIARPSMLLFSPVGDTVALVGAAYGYHVPQAAPDPEGFDGDADAWHEHPMLARAGQRLTMVHLWVTDPPDGPFAHDNATLPFLARGMKVPPAEWLAGRELRNVALALALADAPGQRLLRTARMGGEPLRAAIAVERDSINGIAAGLEQAQTAGDRARYQSLAADAVKHSEQLVATIKNAAPTPQMRDAVSRIIDELIGNHETVAGKP